MESLRRDFEQIAEWAVRAMDPAGAVRVHLSFLDIPSDARIHVVAFGKAAIPMATGAYEFLGRRIEQSIVVAPGNSPRANPLDLKVIVGGHPEPTEGSERGAAAVAELARTLTERDVLVVLISGGGSSLLTLPADGVSRDDVASVTGDLLRAGADIRELNTVRTALDRLKGGGLAALAAPARVVALLVSDVVGDPPELIASGPVTPSAVTGADALGILARYRLTPNSDVRACLEAYEPIGRCGRVETHVILKASMAANVARERAALLGYAVEVGSTPLVGEAREVGARLGKRAREIRAGNASPRPPACVIHYGETTVTVQGDGRGGRNQEVALGAASEVDGLNDVLVASFGTDGIDGPTDAAGAVVTGETLTRAQALGLIPEAALTRNDAYPFFEALGDLYVTGPTGTNVMDLQVILVR